MTIFTEFMLFKVTYHRHSEILTCFNHISGKSTLLAALGNREIPVPDHIDIFHLKREVAASEKTALQCVMEVDQERIRLEREAEELAVRNTDGGFHLLRYNNKDFKET